MIKHDHIHASSNHKSLLVGSSISTLVTLVFATFLGSMNIPITVILPTSVPLWTGLASLIFMVSRN